MSNSQLYTTYLPAKFKCCKSGNYIEYYVENPQTNKLCRKTIKVNRIMSRYKHKRDALRHIDDIVRALNIKLATGYNPFFDGEDARLYTPMREVFAQYLNEKEKECRPDTMRCYRSFVTQFQTFIVKNSTVIYVSMINHSLVAKYLDYNYNVKNNSARTYNNCIKTGKSFFNWCIDKYFTKGNPFEKIKLKKKEKKKRTIIDKDTRTQIMDYLHENDNKYSVVLKLIFYSLIRPKEILMIKLKHINLENHYIFIPGENAKNHNDRYAALTPDLINELQYIKNYKNGDDYLFSDGLQPGSKKMYRGCLTKQWDKLRRTLKLPEGMQMYSFRDTGINGMIKNKIDNLAIMQHADHHSLSMTTLYANHADENLIQNIYENAPEF